MENQELERFQIGFTSSDSFYKPTMVMLSSFFKNNIEKYVFNFIYSETSDFIRTQFRNIIEKNNCIFKEWKVDETIFKGFTVHKRFGYVVYYRVIFPFLVSDNCQKLLWIDSDTVVNGSVKNIFDYGNNYCLTGASYSDLECKTKLGLSKNDLYINAGVVLFNIGLIKKSSTLSNALSFFIENESKFTYVDQCFLSLFYKGQIQSLDLKYNDVIYRVKKYSKSQVLDKMSNDVIIHFVGNIKPWKVFYDSKMYKAYWKYGKSIFGSFYYFRWLVVSRICFIFKPFLKVYKKHRKAKL